MLVQFCLLGFVGLVVLAAGWDAFRFTIPNWLSASVALLFPVAAGLAGFGLGEWGNHLMAGLIALLLGMALFAPGWIGGGDAKLFAASALWFGWPGLSGFLMFTALAGGVLVVVLIAVRKMTPIMGVPASWVENTPFAENAPVPYGIALAGGALWSLPSSIWMTVM